MLQKCLWECPTLITRGMRGMRTATRTEGSVSSSLKLDFSVWVFVHTVLVLTCSLSGLPVSNTRFIAAVIERHTHTPERRRRYWGRSGTESDHGKNHAWVPGLTGPGRVYTQKQLSKKIKLNKIKKTPPGLKMLSLIFMTKDRENKLNPAETMQFLFWN